jgi:hypothetical protein
MASLYEKTRLLDALLDDPFRPSIYAGIAKAVAIVGLAPVLVAAVGYVGAVVRVICQRSDGVTASVSGAFLLFLLGATYVVLYPFLPFSGWHISGSFQMMLRYVAALVVPVGIILFYWALGRTRSTQLMAMAIGLLAAVTSWRGSAEDAGLAMSVGAVILLALQQRNVLARARPMLASPAVIATATTAILALLVVWLPGKQRLTDENLFTLDWAQPIDKAWRAVENEVPTDSRITWYGPKAFIYYPLFGRDLRLSPLRARNDGTVSRPFFEESTLVPLVGIYHDRLAVDPQTFVPNLLAGGVNYVLVTQSGGSLRTETWQGQLEALRASDRAHLVYDDGNSWLWRLDAAGPRGLDGG